MDNCLNISYSSFLCGALLIKKDISNLEISRISSEFEQRFNVFFSQDDGYEKIADYVHLDETGLHLKCNYTDMINYNNLQFCVYDYLYSLTNSLVRSYFNIPNKEVIGVAEHAVSKKRRS